MSLDYIAFLLAQQHMREQFEPAFEPAPEGPPLESTPVPRWRCTLADIFRQLAYRLDHAVAQP